VAAKSNRWTASWHVGGQGSVRVIANIAVLGFIMAAA
jgi:hypothetical protein